MSLYSLFHTSFTRKITSKYADIMATLAMMKKQHNLRLWSLSLFLTPCLTGCLFPVYLTAQSDSQSDSQSFHSVQSVIEEIKLENVILQNILLDVDCPAYTRPNKQRTLDRALQNYYGSINSAPRQVLAIRKRYIKLYKEYRISCILGLDGM